MRDTLQQQVVSRLVADDEAAQVQDRGVEQAVLDEKQDIKNPAGAAVAVGERVDRLELVVLHRHAHQRVDIGAAVHEIRPVIEHRLQPLLPDRRRVDHLA